MAGGEVERRRVFAELREVEPEPETRTERSPGDEAAAVYGPSRLSLGAVDDGFEREADQVAASVAGGGDTGGPWGRRIQRLAGRGRGRGAVHPVAERAIEAARGQGRSVPAPLRRPVEQALGADLRDVRVHTDERAHDLNRLLRARAFTTGRDIYFRRNSYQPTSAEGREVLAHELTHVVQQTGHSPGAAPSTSPTVQRIFTHYGADLDDDAVATVLANLREKTSDRSWQASFDAVRGPGKRTSLAAWLKDRRLGLTATSLLGPGPGSGRPGPCRTRSRSRSRTGRTAWPPSGSVETGHLPGSPTPAPSRARPRARGRIETMGRG